MFEDNLAARTDIDRCTSREHLSVKLVELSRVLVCPVRETGDASNKIKSIVEGIHNFLFREFTLCNPRDFGISFGKLSQSLIHSFKLFLSHERNDAIFTH